MLFAYLATGLIQPPHHGKGNFKGMLCLQFSELYQRSPSFHQNHLKFVKPSGFPLYTWTPELLQKLRFGWS